MQLYGIGLRFGQRRVDPGLRQVHDGDNGCARGHHFTLPRCPHIHFAVDGRHDLGVSFFHLRLFRQRTGIGSIGAGLVYRARRDLG